MTAGDEEIKALVDSAGTSVDPDERLRLYSEAIGLIGERAYWVPLHSFVVTYAHSDELDFQPFPDEIPRFYFSTWK